jgi:hypothetical protein
MDISVQLGWGALTIAALCIGVMIGAAFNRSLMALPRQLGARLRALPSRLKILGRRSVAGGVSAGHVPGGTLTATQRELQVADKQAKENKNDGSAAGQPFEPGKAEKALIGRHEFGYVRFRKPAQNYDDLPHEFDATVADRYARVARQFLSSPVKIATDHLNLYDDEEGAVIVSMFRNSDRPIFYAIDRFRRVVGDNVRRVIGHFIAAVAIPLVLGGVFVFFPDAPIWAAVSGLVISAVAAGAAVYSYAVFRNARDTGFAEFSGLLDRYFAGVSDLFQKAVNYMGQVILGEEDNHAALASNAAKWHKIALWLAFRNFFIESFLRGAIYQSRRNITFYQLLGFFCLFLVPMTALVVFFSAVLIGDHRSFAVAFAFLRDSEAGWFLMFAAFLGAGFQLIVRGKDSDRLLSGTDWRGFDRLQVDHNLGEVIGKYAQEAAIGKRRGVVRPGGGH